MAFINELCKWGRCDNGNYYCSYCGSIFRNQLIRIQENQSERLPTYCPVCGSHMISKTRNSILILELSQSAVKNLQEKQITQLSQLVNMSRKEFDSLGVTRHTILDVANRMARLGYHFKED